MRSVEGLKFPLNGQYDVTITRVVQETAELFLGPIKVDNDLFYAALTLTGTPMPRTAQAGHQLGGASGANMPASAGKRWDAMVKIAQILGLMPRDKENVTELVARKTATAHAQVDGTGILPDVRGKLIWDASGQAVWRFRWPGPIMGAPDLVVDVDAASGTVKRAGMPPR